MCVEYKFNQDVVQKQPIPSLKQSTEDKTETAAPPLQNNTKAAAIEAITGQDFEILTPPDPAPKSSDSSTSGLWLSPTVYLETVEEEGEELMTLSSAINTEKSTCTEQTPKFNRLLSTGVFKKSQHDNKLPCFYRSISVQPLARPNNMFGQNIQDVERMLYRMADAIKKDLELV